MTNLVDLQDKIQKMLNGEKKRKEVALNFLKEFENILEEVAESVWGSGECEDYIYTTWVRNKKSGQNKATDYYYRYKIWEAEEEEEDEYPGFYKSESGYTTWGKQVEDLKGGDFWDAMRCIIEWIPVLVEIIDGRNESRNQLLGLINIKEEN